MATIGPQNPAANPQLNGILSSVPMPTAVFSNQPTARIGSLDPGFSVQSPSAVMVSGQSIVGGGGSTPAAGAQPPAPGAAGTPGNAGAVVVGSAPTGSGSAATGNGIDSPVPTTVAPTETLPVPGGAPGSAAAAGAPGAAAAPAGDAAKAATGSASAEAISGFGKASRNQPIRAAVDGATFGFPSFNSTAKKNSAPAITWGPGWTKVEKDGLQYMQHSNGVRAVPAVEYRITPKPAGKVQAIKVANGWGKKFPDGSVLVFDRTSGPYVLDAKGNKKKIGLGNHTIGGVKVRVFEASVVRTIDKAGKVDVFDSRGNKSTGTTRWANAAVGTADAGASVTGGGKTTGGGATAPATTATTTVDMTKNVQKITEVARGLLAEVRSGNVDPARLASLQAQLSALPAAILQAAGAAGTITSNGPVAGGGPVAGAGSADAASGSTPAPPTPGVDANATTKQLAAGASAKLDASAVPNELRGMQARFAQLPEDLQQKVAAAFGSTQGTRAFAPDRMLAFDMSGTVRVVEAGTLYARHQSQVRGAGPGEDMVMTMRPNRQPASAGAVRRGTATARPATTRPTIARPASSAHSHAPAPAQGAQHAASATGGGATKRASSIQLFSAGAEIRHEDLGGLDGTYTWKTLPAAARAVISSLLRSGAEDPAAKAFASRTGSGWAMDPSAKIVLEAGYATFPSGFSILRGGATTSSAAPAAAGPSNQSGAHDATRPPVGQGSAGAASPGASTPPPAPSIAAPGAHAGHHVGNP